MFKPKSNQQEKSKPIFENQISNQVLNSQEAATFLKISNKSLYRLVNTGLIPCRRVGRQTRFLLSELMEWMKGD